MIQVIGVTDALIAELNVWAGATVFTHEPCNLSIEPYYFHSKFFHVTNAVEHTEWFCVEAVRSGYVAKKHNLVDIINDVFYDRLARARTPANAAFMLLRADPSAKEIREFVEELATKANKDADLEACIDEFKMAPEAEANQLFLALCARPELETE